MSGTEYKKGMDYWTWIKILVGILIFAGIVSMAGSFMDGNVSLHGSESADASAGDGGSELNQPFAGDDDTEDVSEETEAVGYTGKYYPVDDIPSVLVLPDYVLKDRRYKDRGNLRVTNLRYEDGKFKFCVEDPTRPYRGSLQISVDCYVSGIDRFEAEEAIVPQGKKVCFETRDLKEILGKHPQNSVKIEIT